MNSWYELLPWLIAMVVLIGCSAFFSASEAALFYLRAADRRFLKEGTSAEKIAAGLLSDPDRLLTAVLFWNLVINVAYFAISSITAIQLEKRPDAGRSAAAIFAVLSLLTLIFLSEMLPKTVAVLRARWLARHISVPLAIAVRLVDPIMPLLRSVNVLSRRLIWPGFQPESSMKIGDIERAIALSTHDAQLIEQERAFLRNIVQLSDVRVDEWMRPRSQFLAFRPPVALSHLGGKIPPGGYLLITEPGNEEVASAIRLQGLTRMPNDHLEHLAEPVLCVPWCMTVAAALEQMRLRDREVAAVVNEYGDTIGILTFEDILDTVFNYAPSRSKRLLDQNPIHYISPGKWLVAGMTNLNRLARTMNAKLPASKSVTVSGVIQESLQRLASAGDECDWGPFHFRVIEVPFRGHMLVELTRVDEGETSP